MGYFTTRIKPDIVDGDVSKIIASNKADVPFTAGDILFDWQAMQVPKGSCQLNNITVYMVGEDGGAQANKDIHFMFAKSIDGVAPTTLGEENDIQTACFELPLHLVGATKMECSAAQVGNLQGPTFGTIYHSGGGGAGRVDLPIIIEGEPDSGQNVGYDVIYVAAFAGGAFDFSTGVLANAAVSDDTAVTATTGIVTKTVEARKAFQKGDIVYIHDVDTAIGTVASVTDNDIILESANVGAIAEDDEFVNATPITCIFGFENKGN